MIHLFTKKILFKIQNLYLTKAVPSNFLFYRYKIIKVENCSDDHYNKLTKKFPQVVIYFVSSKT